MNLEGSLQSAEPWRGVTNKRQAGARWAGARLSPRLPGSLPGLAICVVAAGPPSPASLLGSFHFSRIFPLPPKPDPLSPSSVSGLLVASDRNHKQGGAISVRHVWILRPKVVSLGTLFLLVRPPSSLSLCSLALVTLGSRAHRECPPLKRSLCGLLG